MHLFCLVTTDLFQTFLVESGNIMLNFSTFFVGGCWGQPMLLFWKLVDETKMYEPPKATRHHNLLKLLILLPVRANLLCTLQSETPCRCYYALLFSRLGLAKKKSSFLGGLRIIFRNSNILQIVIQLQPQFIPTERKFS